MLFAKALIVYGTRNGATTGTSKKIGKILHDEGFDEKSSTPRRKLDIFEYGLIIVGSGMQMGK